MAIDYSGQAWYDETKTWTVNFNAFLEAQKVDSYTLGDFTETEQGDMEMYTDLKIKSSQETKKRTDFYSAKDQKIADYNVYLDGLKQSFLADCQTAEDADYDIAQLPDVPE